VESRDAVIQLRDWLSSAWDFMAMGDFPYPSSYMLNGNGELPAYPVRVACQELKGEGMEDEELLSGEGLGFRV
jgi:lysosomal Pro-X carboxypeptidase